MMHDITANFKIDPQMTVNGGGLWTRHFRNYCVTPEGHLIIKNFSDEFRDKLTAVLNDESLPFSPILPVVPRL